MNYKTAEQLMIPIFDYPHITYWSSVRDAIDLMQHSTIETNNRKSMARSILVFDEENKLIGIVRRRDILKGLEPEELFGSQIYQERQWFSLDIDPNLLEVSYESLLRKLIHRANMPVSEIMRPISHTVNYNDHLLKVIFELSQYNQSLIPVIKDDIVIGVIRTVELLAEIAKEIGRASCRERM